MTLNLETQLIGSGFRKEDCHKLKASVEKGAHRKLESGDFCTNLHCFHGERIPTEKFVQTLEQQFHFLVLILKN